MSEEGDLDSAVDPAPPPVVKRDKQKEISRVSEVECSSSSSSALESAVDPTPSPEKGDNEKEISRVSEVGCSSSSSSALDSAVDPALSLEKGDNKKEISRVREVGCSSSSSSALDSAVGPAPLSDKVRMRKTSVMFWHCLQDNVVEVKKLLDKDPWLVNAVNYDSRTPLHAAALRGFIVLAKVLIVSGADINPQDRWKNTPLADAYGAENDDMIELLSSCGGQTFGRDGSHFAQKTIPPPMSDNCEINPRELNFKKSSEIGKGSFGEIIKAQWRGTPVAVKRILSSLTDDPLVVKDFKQEVSLLVKLRHPNIVQFLGAVTKSIPLMMVTEYLQGGDLYQYLELKGALDPATAIRFAHGIAKGMVCLHRHRNGIIHRDLKPRNILLVNLKGDIVKIGDFGLGKILTAEQAEDVHQMTGETGSYRYMAPEVFKKSKYDKSIDVYSFGMILYEMLEGRPPFSKIAAYAAALSAADGKRPDFRATGIPPELKEMIEQCWAVDAKQRPSFLELVKRLDELNGPSIAQLSITDDESS